MSGGVFRPGGASGATGATGATGAAGANAFTTQAATFTAPAVDATVSIQVASSAWMAIGAVVYIATAGYYEVTAKADATHFTGKNLGYAGNAVATTSITGANLVTAGGLRGTAGATGANGTNGTNGTNGSDGAPGLLVDSQRDSRATDAAIINVADGWTDVLQVSLVLADDTSILEAHANLLGTIVVGAQARLVLDGGNYTDEVIALGSFPVALAQLALPLVTTRPLDAIDTYTLTLQAQGLGVVSSVTPLKDSTLLAHVLSS